MKAILIEFLKNLGFSISIITLVVAAIAAALIVLNLLAAFISGYVQPNYGPFGTGMVILLALAIVMAVWMTFDEPDDGF